MDQPHGHDRTMVCHTRNTSLSALLVWVLISVGEERPCGLNKAMFPTGWN